LKPGDARKWVFGKPFLEGGLAMLETLPFSPNTGQRLIAIARDERLSNLAHVQLLPPHWGTGRPSDKTGSPSEPVLKLADEARCKFAS
jgi:hypothetical protein